MPPTPTATGKLTPFIRAQESLYGPITTIRDPAQWTPPAQSGGHRGRYLWTDAFGVLNFLTLHRETALHHQPQNQPQPPTKDHYLTLATTLITTVHRTLGTTRASPSTPLPPATPTNPLAGGLRIGKPHAHGPDGDGQYHHYLTLWMFALNRTAVATGDRTWNDQAVALARAIHPHFVRGGSGSGSGSGGGGGGGGGPHHPPRMVWKMDVHLEQVLVASEGNLDPVDGWVVFRLLRATDRWFRRRDQQGPEDELLAGEIEDYRRIVQRKGEGFVSHDPLDLGMAMWTAHWFADSKGEEWAGRMAGDCLARVDELFERRHFLDRDLRSRLAFREFGTCLGLRCMAEQSDQDRAVELKSHAERIVECWDPYIWMETGRNATPEELRPITRVMYAAALIPGAFCRGYFGPEPIA
ncbi:hypothetical protein BO86DRAFT_40462 [Aspergillus japonicus CBS 114.51]|uniref:Uncharacterized protein n=1 Tax=Aspergillus japonicus CBS 114.51 TaxID=1448312 RepID=A0A8T8X785_ASPJA|nr:hypothetical protein BO86DRAFT_40462 [Aspergillus japonicus CBS 114.51]RAH83502.1 hypothetical protein BO86DRAFT_40462 [Aspergillus japonicus CBS 114.51]